MNKHWVKIVIVLLVLVALATGALAWLYTGKITEAKLKVFKAIPLPAAIVGNTTVAVREVLAKLPIAQKFQTTNNQNTDSALESSLLDNLIQERQVEILSGKKNVSVSPAELSEIYNSFVQQATNGDQDKFTKILNDSYGITPDIFKNEVLRSQLLKNKLAVWYNSQENLSTTQYKKLRDAEAKAKSGQNFDELVQTYSDDQGSKAYNGDSGPLQYDKLTLEFQKALNGANTGDLRIVSSGVGVHLIKVLEPASANSAGPNNTAKTVHFQNILLKIDGFDNWLSQNMAAIKSRKLIKFN